MIKHERIKRETRPTSIEFPIIFLQRPKKGGENGHLMTLKCKSRKSLWNRLQPENPVVRGKIILWFQTSIWFTTQRNLSNLDLAFLQHCTSYWKAERCHQKSHLIPNEKKHIFQQKYHRRFATLDPTLQSHGRPELYLLRWGFSGDVRSNPEKNHPSGMVLHIITWFTCTVQ